MKCGRGWKGSPVFDMVRHMTFMLELTQMAYNGFSIGRHEGKVIFVPYAMPGERVEVKVIEERMHWAKAELVRVLDESPNRVEPRCEHFGPGGCGGCHWQHIEYGAQLEFKTQIVMEQIRRLGGILEAEVKPGRSVSAPWGYRNHARLHGDDKGWGFVKADKSGILPIKTCPVLHDKLAGLLPVPFPPAPDNSLVLRAGIRTGERMMVLETKSGFTLKHPLPEDTSLVLSPKKRKPKVLAGKDFFHEEVAGRSFRISARSFFQVNTEGAEGLVRLVGKCGQPEADKHVVDLYSGVGLFLLSLKTDDMKTAAAVESDPSAFSDLRANCGDETEGRVQLVQKTVRSALGDVIKSADVVICDPPRRGCGRDVIKKILRLKPARLVYVSCDPATLARDARYLTRGGYRLREVRPVDLFPQTYHIETVSLFAPA
jgi:23S rRNA (uracil1939-C5)-methyltransferase